MNDDPKSDSTYQIGGRTPVYCANLGAATATYILQFGSNLTLIVPRGRVADLRKVLESIEQDMGNWARSSAFTIAGRGRIK